MKRLPGLEGLQATYEESHNAGQLTNTVGARAMTDYTQFISSTLTGT